ncbi:hypothetical protein TRFO_03150 [Tritrichomonas foetus]|uniref:Uncharacterized protein n=1 Tax=Tritrichomonas foetus TaxID=1144522 RepID=A0A1J4KS56_9EUKA|nr:hypothetical protein TRFO_03150 [Tritrichomonas foetus]|eukprot:OHT14121.1 hypothetical protein TRFO_03150 [Tritrichomonas foetus]
MTDEVLIHRNDQIHNLLCGKQQRIGNSHDRNRNNLINLADNTDFSKYPFPDPIEPSRTSQASRASVNVQMKSSRLSQSNNSEFNKLRQDEPMLENVSQYLNVYETNSRRKAMILHQELEEHYMQPLSRKLVRKTTGAEYQKFIRAKSRAITAFDRQAHTQDTYLQELPKIPRLSFDSSDLTDPILKYRKNQEDEKRLTKIIQQSTGEWKAPPTFQERDTMNLKKWKILAETRFYAGKSDLPIPKGKKINEKKYSSEITTELDYFAPPIERKPFIPHPNQQECQRDHIKFGP